MKRSVIDILDLSVEELDELVAVAEDIMANPGKYAHKCEGKKLATMFFEPSTRTRLSFEAAMYELGGNVLSVSSAASSSGKRYTSGGPYSPLTPLKYPGINSLQRKKDASSPSGTPRYRRLNSLAKVKPLLP